MPDEIIGDASVAPAPIETPSVQSPAEAIAESDWEAKYKREVEHRRRERNLYSPVARVIDGLHADDQAALAQLADAIRRGDREFVVDFTMSTLENVTGKSPAEVIAERQRQQGMATPGDIAGQTAAAQAANPTLGPDEIARIVREQLAADRAEQIQAQQRAELADTYARQMRDAGIELASDAGREVIEYCKAFQGDMDKAIKVWRAQQSAVEYGSAAAAAVAAHTPAPAPAGSPMGAAPAPNMSPRERVVARLSARQA